MESTVDGVRRCRPYINECEATNIRNNNINRVVDERTTTSGTGGRREAERRHREEERYRRMNELKAERYSREGTGEGVNNSRRRNSISRVVHYEPATSWESTTSINGEGIKEVDNTPVPCDERISTDNSSGSEDITVVWRLIEGIRREELRNNRRGTGGGVDNSRRRTVGVSSSILNTSSGDNISSSSNSSTIASNTMASARRVQHQATLPATRVSKRIREIRDDREDDASAIETINHLQEAHQALRSEFE